MSARTEQEQLRYQVELMKPLPQAPTFNIPDRASVHSVLLSKRIDAEFRGPNYPGLVFCENDFLARAMKSSPGSSAVDRVLHGVAKIEMVGVDAAPVMTAVENPHSIRNGLYEKDIGHTVCELLIDRTIKIEPLHPDRATDNKGERPIARSVQRSNPFPAIARVPTDCDLLHEAWPRPHIAPDAYGWRSFFGSHARYYI